ncbi:flagellar hook protein FlgE [Tissierella pigra]|uniref:Flagellar hook protein FlgE n=1 Tax=Tissierella pigra TaxID=2607614 RepID=A0A6N7XW53_9FIRM|nr:flagellar hook protein FlgE [Tissierella pigra]MBU5426535.1 flagellar hook protein FlgE [Tissierella pigra]MSU00020.1 flagellar hook protein FlgE [Tissierella pigra]
MMRSMYSAVSGLRVHQSKMDTIGNNIANVNTVGFKRGQVTFQEVFSQVVRGASAPQGGKGGTNPQQIGMGVATGSINTIHTKGPGQRTDNPTDLMIDGDGFFVISSDPNFNNRYYTRAGNFTLDRDGNLVTAEGDKVLGYGVDGEGNITSDVTNIRINMSETKAPTATQKIMFKGNLDSREDVGHKESVDTVIYDSLGNSYKITFELEKETTTAPDSAWKYSVKRITDLATGNYTETDITDTSAPGSGNLIFDGKGKLKVDDSIPDAGINLKINNGIKFTHSKDGTAFTTPIPKSSGEFSDSISILDKEDDLTFKDIHQYANDMGFKPEGKIGNTSGTIEGFTIDATGTVVGVFTNGERKALGQLMLAKFDNPMGLQKLGGNNFIDTRNSGEPQLGKASTIGLGAISPGNLEMSNVDISLEFTEMITTQRGFQANSRIITTSDEMLQELVNMKR